MHARYIILMEATRTGFIDGEDIEVVAEHQTPVEHTSSQRLDRDQSGLLFEHFECTRCLVILSVGQHQRNISVRGDGLQSLKG